MVLSNSLEDSDMVIVLCLVVNAVTVLVVIATRKPRTRKQNISEGEKQGET
jgi:hypothetical protein